MGTKVLFRELNLSTRGPVTNTIKEEFDLFKGKGKVSIHGLESVLLDENI